MKHLFPLCVLVLLLGQRLAWAQAPTWQAAIGPGSGNSSAVKAMAIDGAGNVYLVGYFYNTATLGSTTLLSSAGGEDAFIAKWSPASNSFLWAQSVNGTRDERANGVAVTSNGVYITGTFTSRTTSFGTSTLTNAANNANPDMFVAKLTDAGSFVWTRGGGGVAREDANAIAVQGADIYVVGSFFSLSATFGGSTLRNANGGSQYSADIYVAKLTDEGSSGRFVWAQQAGDIYDDQAKALAVSGSSVYITGSYSIGGANFFGSIPLIIGSDNIYVAKLSDLGGSGNWQWAKQAGGSGIEGALALAVSGSTLYLAGAYCCGSITVGTTTLFRYALDNSYDAFVAQLTDAGSSASFGWAQRFGGRGNDEALAIAATASVVYVAGYFNAPTAEFGSIQLNSAGSEDVFVAKLSTTGAFAWVAQAGSPTLDRAWALAANGTSIWTGGIVTPPAQFGSLTITASGGSRTTAFAARLTDAGVLAAVDSRPRDGFALWPNPVGRSTTLTLPPTPGAPRAVLTLIDALGRTVRTTEVDMPAQGVRYELELKGVPAGWYLLRVEAGGFRAARRLLVEPSH